MRYRLYWTSPQHMELHRHSGNDSLEWIEETALTQTVAKPELTYWLYEVNSGYESLIKMWRGGQVISKEDWYS